MLIGGEGSDTMSGGLGNDTYVVESAGDNVIEYSGQGIDTVWSSISYSLTANVENLVLTGHDRLDGTGNELDNHMVGNDAANVLAGLGGNDTLIGGAGADILQGGDGNDVLVAENLPGVAQPIVTQDASGKEHDREKGRSDNRVSGNLLDGGAGNDMLVGGAGNDMLVGGTGNDVIDMGGGQDIVAFNLGDGQDTLLAGGSHDGTLSLGDGIGLTDLSLSHVGNDLVVNIGAADSITLSDWYAGNHAITDLQLISQVVSASNTHGHESSSHDNKSHDSKSKLNVIHLDFSNLVGQFDASAVTDVWSLTNAKLDKHLEKTNGQVLGGEISTAYATTGSMDGITLGVVQSTLGESSIQDMQKLKVANGACG